MKHKVGDVVKITQNKHSHGFEIGEDVKIIYVSDIDYRGEVTDGSDRDPAPWFNDEDIE